LARGSSRSVEVVSPAPRSAWSEVLRADPGATALQTPEYFAAVLNGTGGQDASRLYVRDDGRRLVLPLIRRRLPRGVDVHAGFPGGYGHGGVLAEGGLQDDDVRLVAEDLRGRTLSTRIGFAHHTAGPASAGSMPGVVQVPRTVSVVDLSAGVEQLRQKVFERTVRQSLRKAERAGLEVECGTGGKLVPEFYELYLAWVERWIPRSGLPPRVARWVALRQEPRAKFETVTRAMGDDCRVFIARHQGRAVASCITFVHGAHAIGWRSYSLKELAAPVAANTFVQVAGLTDACASGCRWFDLGQSGGAPDLLKFKRSMGGRPQEAVDLRIEPASVTSLRTAANRVKGGVVGMSARLLPTSGRASRS
jgi:CelD/BcsL family acetyltransferase involved in cellulose biosynthesis